MNKYLEKIAANFPTYQGHEEFDMAYKDADNPTRERLERYFKHKDADDYHAAVEDYRWDSRNHDHQDPYAERPELPYRGDFDHRSHMENEQIALKRLSGEPIPTPSKVGLGLGYGAGAAGLVAGAALRNPALALGGGIVAGVTGLYHLMNSENGQRNRYLSRVRVLNGMKEHALRRSQELDGL